MLQSGVNELLSGLFQATGSHPLTLVSRQVHRLPKSRPAVFGSKEQQAAREQKILDAKEREAQRRQEEERLKRFMQQKREEEDAQVTGRTFCDDSDRSCFVCSSMWVISVAYSYIQKAKIKTHIDAPKQR